MQKALVCSVCGYIHLKETAPEKCPICQANSKVFALKDDALKTKDDVSTVGESYKKHLPVISVNNVSENVQEIKATIGELEHPMLPEHYITSITFYVDKEYVGCVALTPKLKPEASIYADVKGKKISVIENCNIHGNWISEENK